jgi:uncharacterized repeat protein (TIGR03803 family)
MQKSLPMAVLIGALFAFRVPCDAATPILTTLYNLPDTNGAFPEAGLLLNNGQLVGTTYAGGLGWGTVFSLSQSAGVWSSKELYAFTGLADGANPRAGLIVSSRGVYFGTTEQGGAWGYGTVFSLTPATGGKWTQAVLYSFTGVSGDGANPEASVTLNPTTNVLFGTTNGGGATGNGTVFSLTPSPGGTWTEKVLYSFAGSAGDGANPLGPLTLSPKAVLYGTTYGGGTTGWGTVFQLASVAGVWTEKVLYNFLGAPSGAGASPPVSCGTSGQPACDGGAPAGNLVYNGASGALYGTTTLGGKPTGCPLGGYEQGCGVVFQLTPPVAPSTTWTESLLYTFGGPPTDGMLPSSTLVYSATGGTLYGTTFTGGSSPEACFPASYTGCGIVYTLRAPTPPATVWTKNNMAIFNGDNGGGPNGVILSPAGGLLYGTTYEGGLAGGYGTVFQVAF